MYKMNESEAGHLYDLLLIMYFLIGAEEFDYHKIYQTACSIAFCLFSVRLRETNPNKEA